ncbi:MAG: transposase [Phycisphaerae bacterium]
MLLRADSGLKRGKSGWTQGSLEALRQCTRPLPDCQPDQLWRGILGSYLDQLDLFRKQLAECDQKLEAWARHDPRLQWLTSIPGVGVVTAATLVAVLDDARRFRSRRQVAAYAGLTPRAFSPVRSIARAGSANAATRCCGVTCAEQKAAPLRSGLGWGVSPCNGATTKIQSSRLRG